MVGCGTGHKALLMFSVLDISDRTGAYFDPFLYYKNLSEKSQ